MKNETETKSKRSLFGRSLGFLVILSIWIVNAILRIYFGYLTITGVQLLDVQISPLVHQSLTAMFLFLGASGVTVSVGFWMRERWGYLGVVIVSILTILFDIWGVTIQFTAAFGFIAPVIVMLYLFPRRMEFTINSRVSIKFDKVNRGGIIE